MKLKIYTAILITPIILSAQGCGMFCNAYTRNGTANMDGYCANHWYTGGNTQSYQQQAPAYDWNSTPTTNLTGSFGGGQQTQLQGLPNQNKPSCVSRTINGVMQSCQ